MTIKVTAFEAENVKRIKAVQFQPSENGLTIVGGKNGQGKTSVLDAIAWTLGGNRMKPSEPHRTGSVQDPTIRIVLNNGLIVERKGKNSELKVTDPTGKRSGQTILDNLIGEMALNVPKFMAASPKEKAGYLLKVIGIGDQLKALDKEEEELFNRRKFTGQQYRSKKAHADEMEAHPEAGFVELSAADLIQRQQEILLRNAENAKKRQNLSYYSAMIPQLEKKVAEAEEALKRCKAELSQGLANLEAAQKDALDLYDESTEELERDLAQIDLKNRYVRQNLAKQKAMSEAEDLKLEYQTYSNDIESIRAKRMALLDNAPLPLKGLSVRDGEILYKDQRWDGMSGSDQLKVSAAICRAVNPKCGFVLLDKLEQMDLETLNDFGRWLEAEGLQAIATRVSTGEECSLIIEDGRVKGEESNDSERSDQNSDLGTAWSW